jgi:cytochrome c peroxidase
VYDVGLRDEQGIVKFNPPSLRGVGHGVAFFHDARRKSLDDLFRLDRHQLDGELKAEELRALVRYLQGI